MKQPKDQDIAAIEYPLIINLPPLNDGEKFVGVIVSGDGAYRHAVILLPGEAEPNTWEAQMAWAASRSGDLPDRVESALLFATLRGEFQLDWYWTREQLAETAGFAWMQTFTNGDQLDVHKGYEWRARAVRRLSI